MELSPSLPLIISSTCPVSRWSKIERQGEHTKMPSLLTRRLLNVMADPLAINVMDRPIAIQGRIRDVIKNSEVEISRFRRIHLLL